MKLMNKIVNILGYILIGASISMMLLFYFYYNKTLIGFNEREFSNQLGNIGVIFGFLALGIWIIRKLHVIIKKKETNIRRILHHLTVFLHKHHVLIGWITIFVSTAHGVYYLLNYPNKLTSIVTGIITWSILILLSLFGVVMEYKLKKKVKHKKIRLYHFILGLFFAIGIIVHIL